MPDPDDYESKTVILPHGKAEDSERVSEDPHLLCVDAPPGSGIDAGTVYVLGSGRATTIGRKEGNDIVLPIDLLSRRHATIQQDNGVWSIRDLKSLNGTLVNGTRFVTHTLRPGDQIQLGGITLCFQHEGAGSQPILRAPLPASAPPARAPERRPGLVGIIVAALIAGVAGAVVTNFFFVDK